MKWDGVILYINTYLVLDGANMNELLRLKDREKVEDILHSESVMNRQLKGKYKDESF